MTDITQSYLKSILNYNSDTGVFTWRVNRYSGMNYKIIQAKAGDVAGYFHHSGYIIIKINKKVYPGHRLAWLYMYGKFPDKHIDHINHIRSDNRINNLREATQIENNRNAKKRKDNKSGHTGVIWHKVTNKWAVVIGGSKKGNRKHLGVFADLSEAIAVRKQAEIDYGYHNNHGKAA